MLSLTTFTGKEFYPFDVHHEVLCIEDIAHSLSFQCRFAGHISEFYSIAQHCVYVSWLVEEKYKLCALMHDAAEAYLSDVPTPIKAALPTFKKIENEVMEAIATKYNFPWPEPKVVKDADTALLFWEMYYLFPNKNIDKDYLTVDFQFEIWDHKKAEKEFLKHFQAFSQI